MTWVKDNPAIHRVAVINQSQCLQISCTCSIKTLARISKDETAPHAAQVAASQADPRPGLTGKAPTFSSTDTTQFKRAIDMTDDEASRHRLTCHASCGQVAQRDCESMLATRFICARKSWHVDHRGEIRQRGSQRGDDAAICHRRYMATTGAQRSK